MSKRVFLILGLVLFLTKVNFSQEKCECCTYNSIDNIDLFEDFFNPQRIVEKGISKAIISTTEKFDDTLNNYLQTEFTFNKKGYVISRKWFYHGKPNHLYEYERNSINQITKVSFSYLDSTGVNSDLMPHEITDYTYDKAGRIVRTKERDSKGNILADSISNYVKYEYNQSGKVSRKVTHYFFNWYEDPEHDYYEENISYQNDLKSTSEIFNNNKLWLTKKSSYNSLDRVILNESFNVKLDALATITEFTYLESGEISSLKEKSGKGAGTECLDGGNFNEEYHYDKVGLLFEILHRYDEVECKLTIEYK